MSDQGDYRHTTRFFNHILIFRIVLGVIITFSWSVLLFCAMELYERIHWKQIRARNELVLTAQSKRAKFTQAFNKSLWDLPWYSYKKNQNVAFDIDGKLFQIKTNNVGLRDDNISIPKPERLFRILCIGGSTTIEGWTNEATYPNLLEKRLQKTFPNVSLEVINCGVSGLNSYSELIKISEYLDLDPDLILEYNAVNDICWLYFPYIRENTKWWKRLFKNSWFLTHWINRHLQPEDNSIRAYLERTTIENLLGVHQAAAKKKIPVVFCSFSRPDLKMLTQEELEFLDIDLQLKWKSEHVTYKSYSRIVDIYNHSLKNFCERTGIPYIPVAENHRGGLDYFIDICHCTDEGIDKKVDIIYDYLKNYLPSRFKHFAMNNPYKQPPPTGQYALHSQW